MTNQLIKLRNEMNKEMMFSAIVDLTLLMWVLISQRYTCYVVFILMLRREVQKLDGRSKHHWLDCMREMEGARKREEGWRLRK